MKITVYTINDCKFSQAEKQYLQSKNIPFEEKNLEANREFLTEMLTVSNNFAGTPVTKIEKDDGQVMVLKGFTKDEFDKALGSSETAAPTAQPAPAPQASEAPAAPQSAAPAPQPTPEPKVEPMMPPTPPVSEPAPFEAPPTPPPVNQVQVANDMVLEAAPPAPTQFQQPMNTQAPAQPEPMQQQQPQPNTMTANTMPSTTPAEDTQAPSQEALTSVLQDLQSRVNDGNPTDTQQ